MCIVDCWFFAVHDSTIVHRIAPRIKTVNVFDIDATALSVEHIARLSHKDNVGAADCTIYSFVLIFESFRPAQQRAINNDGLLRISC